jgi:hypothetical protein
VSGKTFLTQGWPPEIQKKLDDERIANNRKWDLAQFICDRTIEAYAEGQITSAVALGYIVNSLSKPKADLDRVPGVYRAFYHDRLIEITPKKRNLGSRRSDPKWIKQLSLNLILRSQRDGFTVSRESLSSNNSAFLKVEKLLKEAGVNIPASTILSWYSSKKVRKKIFERKQIVTQSKT